jgi:hypothetical protein
MLLQCCCHRQLSCGIYIYHILSFGKSQAGETGNVAVCSGLRTLLSAPTHYNDVAVRSRVIM